MYQKQRGQHLITYHTSSSKGYGISLGILMFIAVVIFSLVGCQRGSENRLQELPKVVDFNYHIKPILSDRCFACHGPDEKARKADFRLDLEETAFSILDSATNKYAIVPGSLKKSHLIQRISSTDADYMMPPPESNLTLSPYEISLLKRWIEQGAKWKPHWAFIPPQTPELPDVRNKQWVSNEIDLFILQRLEKEALDPAPKASKEKLLRRLSFDLTGLPPEPEALNEFLADDSDDAYERQVDRLLASAAYGERMASIWLEAARYADSHGYQDDRPRTIWPWRDWVINAFNQNLSYKDFIVWQLAGDLLPDASYQQKLATAFNRNHAITQEGGVINEEYITEYVADRTNTTATAFMGLTMQCARCHDHKYDPISQKEYYQMFAFFNGMDEKGQIDYFDEAPKPNIRVQDAEMEATITFLDSIRVVKELEFDQYPMSGNSDYQRWRNQSLSYDHIASQLSKGMVAHFKLDHYQDLSTPNEVTGGKPGQVNVKIITELMEPDMIESFDGRAMKFDGKNYLSLGDVGDFEESMGFSMGAWIKPLSYPDEQAGLLVRRNGEQRRGGYELVLEPKGSIGASLVHNQSDERLKVSTRGTIPLHRWSHVFMTYDGSGMAAGVRLFINGKEQPLVTILDRLENKSILNGNDFLVGNWTPRRANSAEYQGFINGAIDEVRIYNRSVSTLEIKVISRQIQPGFNLATLSEKILQQYYLFHFDHQWGRLKKELDSVRSIYLEVPNVMIMQEMDTPRATYVLDRGVYDAPLEKVTPGTPVNILPFPDDYPQNRLGLAKWLIHPEHPLTARVLVNRLWLMMFGRGLVNTPEDFGNQGDLPSHGELLDWLAISFIESDWDVKAVLKLMAQSSTYQQSARTTPKKQRQDPENVLLSRGPYRRLDAEMLRDQALAASGLLNKKVGGKWVKPYQPPGIWKELANQIGENKYRPSKGEDLYRRSLYSYWKRTIPPPFMLTFDASERAVCVLKRQTTSTPLQALGLLNDPQFIEASRVLAQAEMKIGQKPVDWINGVFFRLTTRYPNSEELDNLLVLFNEEREEYVLETESAQALLSVGAAHRDAQMDQADLAALTVVTNIILNLDEAKRNS